MEARERPGSVPRASGPPIRTVGELTRELKDLLETEFDAVRVRGELSGFKIHAASGHAYFSLKDDRALLGGVAWSSAVRRWPTSLLDRLRREPDGLSVIAAGRIGVYEPRGQYQLYVNELELEGAGDLHAAFLRLKAKLEAEGLFDPARKRPLPAFPRRIGLLTSGGGAALRDMLRITARRWPSARVVLRAVAVQGPGAAEEIARGLADLDGLEDLDVIIAGRGGGSLEDLWAFNEEVVARAIAASRTPVVSAVGHETDFSIADFVADVRAATPSQAAELVTPDRADLARRLRREEGRLRHGVRRRMEIARLRLARLRDGRGLRRPEDLLRRRMLDLDRLTERLRFALTAAQGRTRERLGRLQRRLDRQEPREQLASRRARLHDLRTRWVRAAERRLQREGRRIDLASARLSALGPDAVLARGYGLVVREADGTLVRSAAQAGAGEQVRVRLHEGALRCRVEESVPNLHRESNRGGGS